MKQVLQLLSYVGLALTVLPSFGVLAGSLSVPTHKTLMLIGTILWLASAPFWIFRRHKSTF